MGGELLPINNGFVEINAIKKLKPETFFLA